MIQIIRKAFNVDKVGSAWGSCTEEFLNNKAVEIAVENNFPKEIIELFKNNPYRFPFKNQRFSNGIGAGIHYLRLLESKEGET